MAKKEEFDKIKKTDVYGTMESATADKDVKPLASPEEQERRLKYMKTQGKKGCHAMRMNMAFQPDNYQYIKVMSRITGMTHTQYVNYVLEQYRLQNGEVYDKAKEIINMLGTEGYVTGDLGDIEDEDEES